MSEERMPKRMMKGRLYTTRCRRQAKDERMRWLDGVTEDLASMEIRGWRTGKDRGVLLRRLKPAIGCNAS